MSNFTFELDPSTLPKLNARGDNFPEYRSVWTTVFRYAGLWPLISKERARPVLTANANAAALATHTTDADAWDADDTKALVMILSSVHNNLTQRVASCETSSAAWDYLTSRFDRDTGQSSINNIILLRSLTNLRYRDGDDLRLHLGEFHQRWFRISKRCASSTQPVAVAMKAMLSSDDVKGSFFLATLPDTMDNIIADLATRQLTSFQSIETALSIVDA